MLPSDYSRIFHATRRIITLFSFQNHFKNCIPLRQDAERVCEGNNIVPCLGASDWTEAQETDGMQVLGNGHAGHHHNGEGMQEWQIDLLASSE